MQKRRREERESAPSPGPFPIATGKGRRFGESSPLCRSGKGWRVFDGVRRIVPLAP